MKKIRKSAMILMVVFLFVGYSYAKNENAASRSFETSKSSCLLQADESEVNRV